MKLISITAVFFFSIVSYASAVTKDKSLKTSGELTISSSGVGPIIKATKFEKNEISKLFPGFQISEEQELSEAEGLAVDIIRVSLDSDKILDVRGDEDGKFVLSVIVFSSRVRNSFGPKIGAPFFDVFKSTNQTFCEFMSERLTCQVPSSDTVSYVFEGKWKGPEYTLPPAEALQAFRLKEIFWVSGSSINEEDGAE